MRAALLLDFVVVVVVVVASARGARGQPVPFRPSVLLHVAAPAPVVESFVERLRPRLAAQAVDLVVTEAATVDVDAVLDTAEDDDAHAPLAQVWLDGRSLAAATVFVVPRLADRVLSHGTALPNGFDEVALAELVFVVERSVTALLDAQVVGVPKEEARALLHPPPPLPTPIAVAPPAPSPEAPAALRAGVFFGGEGWSSEAPLVPVLGVVGTMERAVGATRIGVSLDAAWRPGFDIDTARAKLSVVGGAAHLSLTLGRAFGDLGALRLFVGPGLALDRVRATPSFSASRVDAPARTDVALALGVRLRWDLPLSARSALFAVAGVDVVSVAGRYTATIDGVTTTLMTSWPVRPTVALGFAYGGK